MGKYSYEEQLGDYRAVYGFDTVDEMDLFLRKHQMGPYNPKSGEQKQVDNSTCGMCDGWGKIRVPGENSTYATMICPSCKGKQP